MEQLTQLALRLSPKVMRLQAVLTPIAHGGRDSHGYAVDTEQKLKDRLLEAIDEVAGALADERMVLK